MKKYFETMTDRTVNKFFSRITHNKTKACLYRCNYKFTENSVEPIPSRLHIAPYSFINQKCIWYKKANWLLKRKSNHDIRI